MDIERIKSFYKNKHSDLSKDTKLQLYEFLKTGKMPENPTRIFKALTDTKKK